MTGERFFIDTNLLVYAHDTSEPEKQKKCQDIIFHALRTDEGVISPQVLSEFFVTVTGKIEIPITEEQARNEIFLLEPLCAVDLDASLVIRALEIRRRWQIRYWDALIVSTAERAGCSVLYSEYLSNGQRVGDVRVVNPFAKTP